MNKPKECIGCCAEKYWNTGAFQFSARCTECIHFRKTLKGEDHLEVYPDYYFKA